MYLTIAYQGKRPISAQQDSSPYNKMPSQLYARLFKELILMRQNLIAQSFHSIFIFGEVKVSLRWWSTFANYAVDRSVTVKQGHSYYSEGTKKQKKQSQAFVARKPFRTDWDYTSKTLFFSF